MATVATTRTIHKFRFRALFLVRGPWRKRRLTGTVHNLLSHAKSEHFRVAVPVGDGTRNAPQPVYSRLVPELHASGATRLR